MRKPIRKMVQKYYEKSKIKIPVDIKFARVKTPAKLRTIYNPKTKEYMKNVMQLDDKHYQELAKVDIKNAKVYLQRSIAHELGHLKRVEDSWEDVRRTYIKGYSDPKEEDFADNYSKKLTGIGDRKFNNALKTLQQKYDQSSKERHLKEKEKWEKGKKKREEKYKKRLEGIKKKYSNYFKN